MTGPNHEITGLLQRWREGEAGAEAALMERVHRELRRVAAAHLRRERGDHTLQPTAVVNEAYLRLVPQRTVAWQNRAHFFGIAAKLMRRILVDHARRRHAIKRDAPAMLPIVVDPAAPSAGIDPLDVIRVHEALEALAALDARQAAIVEARYFAGLTIEETAEALNLSPATVKREWSAARLFLLKTMRDRART